MASCMAALAPAQPDILIVSGSTCRISWRIPPIAPAVQQIAIRVMDDAGNEFFCDSKRHALVKSETDALPYPAHPAFAVITGLRCGTHYRARIMAKSNAGWSQMSDWSLSKGILPPQLPEAPTLQIVNSSTLRISWKVPASTLPVEQVAISIKDDAENYYYCDSDSGSLVSQANLAKSYPTVPDVPDSHDSVLVYGFARGVKYRANINAESEAGWSDCSSWSSQVELEVPENPEAPILSVVDSTTMHVSWTLPRSSLHVTRVAIDILDESGNEMYCNSSNGELVHNSPFATSYPARPAFAIVKGFLCGTKYRARIVAENEAGWSDYSASSDLVGLEPPKRPLVPKLSIADESSLLVTWSLPESVLVVEAVSIRFEDESGKHSFCDKGELVHTNGLQFSKTPALPAFTLVRGFEYGRKYKAQLAAKSEAGWSCYSDFCFSISPALEDRKRSVAAMSENESSFCIVCLNERPQIAFDPCGHLCACEPCGSLLNECPVCRRNAKKRLRIYY